MGIIELIFKVIAGSVPVDKLEYARMKEDADKWYNEINVDNEEVHPVMKKLKIYGETWYIKLAMAVSYPWLLSFMWKMANPQLQPQDEDED
nr:hypothetical protein [uncultured Draconibacterium sp.]